MADLNYEPKTTWETYCTSKDSKAMNKDAREYIDFLTACKTERETIRFVAEALKQAGIKPASTAGKSGLCFTLGEKALVAFRRGKRPLKDGMRLISAHADTPRLDFKQRPIIEQVGAGQAKTHYYGGIRKYQWLARPLAIHGVVVREDGTRMDIRLGEDPGDPVFTISDLLPHLAQQDQEKTLAKAFEAEKLNLILAHSPLSSKNPKNAKKGTDAEAEKSGVRAHILDILHKTYGVTEEDLISAELQAVPAGPARFVGLDKALIGGYGHDDRICVWCGLKAFLEVDKPEYTTCIVFWDKEEIGSEGSGGASGRFFEYSVRDMLDVWEPETRFRHLMLKTKALSADVSAGIDPDWQELHEKQNSARLGYGVALNKFTGSRGKYGANDANPEYVGWMRKVLNSKGIPWQMSALGKVDVGGGGTVALFLAVYGMDVLDAGPAVLSMHSPFELAAVADLYGTRLAYKAFFEAE